MKEDYIVAAEAAKKWGVSQRQVQRLLAAGRIDGARKLGGRWLIPAEAEKPDDPRRAKGEARTLPYLSSFFQIGNPNAILEYHTEQSSRKLGEAYLAYLRCDFEPVKKFWRELPPGDETEPTAAVVAMTAAIGSGDYGLYDDVRQRMRKRAAETEDEATLFLYALPEAVAAVSMDVQSMTPDWVKLGSFQFLPESLRDLATLLHLLHLRNHGEPYALLAAAQTAITFHSKKNSFSEMDVYFRLMAAVACNALRKRDEARRYIDEALELSVPYGMLLPLAEHTFFLGGLVEERLKELFPTTIKPLMGRAAQVSANWLQFHNIFTGQNITTILTAQEYHVARLLRRGATYEEAARQMNLSLGRVRNIVSDIYSKLHINSRSQLQNFIL